MPQEISHELSVNKIINPLANILVVFSNDNIAVNNIYSNISILSNGNLTNNSDLTTTLKSNGIIPPTFSNENINLSIKTNEVFSLNTYKEFCSENNLNYQFAKANHFNINNQISNIVKSEPNPTQELTCHATAKILVANWKNFIVKVCQTPGPRQKTAVCALAIGLNEIFTKPAELLIYAGCEYTISEINDKAIEIYMNWKSETNKSVKEMLLWLEFINTVEGMMWLTNKINQT